MNTVVSIQILKDQAVVRTLTIDAPASLSIGRKADAQIQLEDDAVSRKHGRLLLGSEAFVLEDASANGTRIYPSDVVRGSQIELA